MSLSGISNLASIKSHMVKLAIALGAGFMLAACSTSTPYDGLVTHSIPTKGPHFGDADPQEFGYRTPQTYPIHGIDMSKWQSEVDWREVRNSRIKFAFIKATEGGDHLDRLFATHWNNAAKVRMPRGAYHFYYFCTSPEDQARWFIRNVPKDPNALPPVLDVEWNHHSPSCKRRPDAVTLQAEMRTFLRIIERHYGKKPLIYTTVDFYKDAHLSTFKDYPLWLRSVADHPKNVYGPHPWLFWQYTGTGKVPGIEGNTDINVFAGSQETWAKWVRENTKRR